MNQISYFGYFRGITEASPSTFLDSEKNKKFDLAYSINTFHNLFNYDLEKSLKEITRVSRKQYICVESYKNEIEKVNLLYWQVTCESFYTPKEWRWFFEKTKYKGDYSFIYFK